MTDTITLRLIVGGEDTVTVDRAEYEAAKVAGEVDQLLDAHASDIETETIAVEPGGTVVELASGRVLPPAEPVYLIWSNHQGAWWGPEQHAYVYDVWSAGRYDEDEARKACARRTWAQNAEPPEVMVLAPEHGRGPFTAAEIARVPEQMRRAVDIETKGRIADRAAAVKA
jgi:hypothetical protein